MRWSNKKQTKEFGRVDRTDELKRAEKNKMTLESPQFKKACELANVKPTKRQASKWNRKQGAAYAYR